MQNKNLKTLFMSTEWNESVYAKEALGNEVVRHIIGPNFGTTLFKHISWWPFS